MADVDETPYLTPARQAEHKARDKRLAAALRANLQRRKEQARARADEQSNSARALDTENQ